MNSLISCRVRLARNVKDLPFPKRMNEEQRRKLIGQCCSVLTEAAGGQEFEAVPLDAHNRTTARVLIEQHLISPEFAAENAPHAAALSRDRSVSVMICEEDHLRIQVFGLSFEDCLQKARRIDALLDERLPMAFSERLGYLTACPTNLGTGLRASVMLHLPCLTQGGQIASLAKQIQGAGLSIRGLYGEGSRAGWGYHQISNAVTLGFTEDALCAAVWDIALRLDALETEARQKLRGTDPIGFSDRVWRAWGLLSHARRITTTEAMEALQWLRMGSLEGEPGGITKGIDELAVRIWPAHLVQSGQGLTEQPKRDEARAKLIRQTLESWTK